MSSSKLSPKLVPPSLLRLGILGDGQLSRMLAKSGIDLSLNVTVLSSDRESPAARTGVPVVWGETSRLGDLRSLFSKIDIVVFENEFLDRKLLEEAASGLNVQFVPSLDNLELFQDKLRQKHKLEELKIPCSPHLVWDSSMDPSTWVSECFKVFGAVVFKWSRMGYDGKGVFISDSMAKDQSAILDFLDEAQKRGIPVYAEKKISFRRELAVIACGTKTADFKAYPLVISRQENGICREVIGPAVALGVSPSLEVEAHAHARAIAKSCNLIGIFAIEFFEDENGKLLVNEIAPRVHNTGHYTQDAAETSQFENHWHAVLGEKLGSVGTSRLFMMWNLLGPDGIAPLKNSAELVPVVPKPLRLHWYEKSEIRSRRKLGHINSVAQKPQDLERLREEIRKVDHDWALSLKLKTE